MRREKKRRRKILADDADDAAAESAKSMSACWTLYYYDIGYIIQVSIFMRSLIVHALFAYGCLYTSEPIIDDVETAKVNSLVRHVCAAFKLNTVDKSNNFSIESFVLMKKYCVSDVNLYKWCVGQIENERANEHSYVFMLMCVVRASVNVIQPMHTLSHSLSLDGSIDFYFLFSALVLSLSLSRARIVFMGM